MSLKKYFTQALITALIIFFLFPLCGWFWGILIEENDGSPSMKVAKVTMDCGDTLSRQSDGSMKYASGWKHDNTANEMYLNDTTEELGIGVQTPDKKVEILDSAQAQLRLTHTDAVDYTDFTTDTNGDLTIDVSGDEIKFSDAIAITNSAAARDVIYGKGAAAQSGDYLEIVDNSSVNVFKINSSKIPIITQSTGEEGIYILTDDDCDDEEYYDLPSGVRGAGIAWLKTTGGAGTSYGGTFAVGADGTTYVEGTADFSNIGTGGDFCVIDNGTNARVWNRVTNNTNLHVIFFYH